MAAVRQLISKSAPPRTDYTSSIHVVASASNRRHSQIRGPLGEVRKQIPGGFKEEPLRGSAWYIAQFAKDPSGEFLKHIADDMALRNLKEAEDDEAISGFDDPLTNDNRKIITNRRGTPVSVMANRYAVISHSEVYNAVIDRMVREMGPSVLNSRADLIVSDYGLSCSLQVVLEDLAVELSTGEKLFARLKMFNSLDGSSKVGGAIDLWRLVCHNGMHTWKEFTGVAAIHSKSRTDTLDITSKISGVVEAFPRVAEAYNRWIEHRVDPLRLDAMFQQRRFWDEETQEARLIPSKAEEIFGRRLADTVYSVLHDGGVAGHRAGIAPWGKQSAYDLYNGASLIANFKKGVDSQATVIEQAVEFVDAYTAQDERLDVAAPAPHQHFLLPLAN